MMTSTGFRKLLALCAAGATMFAAAAPASAQGTSFYIGASAGTTSSNVCDNLGGLGLTACDDGDTGLKIYGGALLNQNFALELGYADLGKVTATGPGGTATASVDGLQFAALGILPLNPKFSLFGKVGLYLWDVKVAGSGGSISDDGNDIMLGLGLMWNLTQQFALRAEWERFDVDGDDIDMISVGAQFRF
jgi:OOP family OmpA-OmpF porin